MITRSQTRGSTFKMKKKNYFCDKCNITFPLESMLNRHKVYHNINQRLNKMVLRKVSSKKSNNKKEFNCRLCQFNCNLQEELITHREREHCSKADEDDIIDELDTSGGEFKIVTEEELIAELKGFSSPEENAEVVYEFLGEETQPEFQLEPQQQEEIINEETLDQNSNLSEEETINEEALDEELLSEKEISEILGELQCDICGFKCTNKNTMYSHKRRHRIMANENLILSCDKCDYKAVKKSSLLNHIFKKHTSKSSVPEVLSCSLCEYKNKNKYELKIHIARRHTQDYKFTCEFCGKKFKVKGDLTNHIRFSHKEHPVICDVCGKTCLNSNSLYVHQKFAHYKAQFECHICKRRMVTQQNLNEHMVRQHEKREKAVCEECGKTFSRNSRLKIHMRIHTGDRPYVCQICGKTFIRRTALKQHLLIHTGVKPYVCDICGKAFTQKPGYLNKSGRTGASGDPRGFFIFDKESVVMRKWQILEFDGKPYYAFVPEDEEPVNIDNIPSSEDQPEFELEPPNHTPEINFLHQDEPEADPELAEEHIIKDFNLPVQCKTEVLHQEEENEHMSVENDASFYDYQYDDTSIMNDSEETEMKPILMNNICGTEGKEATRGDLYECKIEGSIVTIEKLAENVVSVDNSTKNDDNDDEDDDNNHDNDTQYDHDNNNDSYEGYNYEENDTCELEDQEEQIQEVEEFVESEEIEEIETDQQIGSQSEFIEEEEVEEVEGIEENEGEIEVEYEGENEGEEVELEEDIEVDAEGNIISENITEEEQAQEVPQYIEFDSIDSQVIEYATENEEDVDDVGVEKIQEAPQATVVPVGVATKNHRQTRYRPILPKSMPTFRCTLCSETFPSKIAFRKHVAWTHKKKVCIQEDGAYVCAVCDYRTLKKNLFAAHLERKHETWPKKGSSNVDFPCVVCGFKCRSKHSLQSHFIRKHTDTFEHQCKFCPKQFKVKGDLTNHVRFHHKEKPVNCTVCGKLCQNSGSLYVHQKWAHFKPKFECKICKRRMVTQENLEQHMLTQHEKREKIVCAECGKTFTKKDSFKRHMAVHTGSKPHNCPICNKAFARQSQLRQHVLIHTGKRPFVCDICGKAFTQKPGLICHRKTHPGSHPPLPAMPIADIVKEFTEGYLRGNGAHANDINEDEVEAISD
ncbi:hypothetical protein KQX54_002772 [Cotesia glomerata]|uniref:C2H2-type domain-containing protein n=1 Tax=Cotesia glomerata TaxID=32391 RepID=A0AAV7J3L7_COTGL|nr:hypothetical protein KQX54_002772 [Cotesia glomerata]